MAERFYSIGCAAHLAGCTPDEFMRLIVEGVVDADADLSGAVLLVEEEQVERAKGALKARSGQDEPVIRQ